MFLLQSVVTCGALFWLLHRAWLTLWKPVPELIGILGVEVPDVPEVFLSGIKAETVTLTWERPGSSRPLVTKYLIQVNGVNVGDAGPRDTAITVMGLKSGHFYNVRVIAVGNNNFQTGSRVIRLRTYGKDGRPDLRNGQVPPNLTVEDMTNGTVVESSDEGAGVRAHGAGVETAITENAPAMVREASTGHASQRRNTGGRRHSPSTASDHPPLPIRDDSGESMIDLTERFNAIKNETEGIGVSTAKEREEFDAHLAELIKERDEKRHLLKEKEEASEKLKREVNVSERTNRQAQTRKTNKEKALRDKEVERKKMQDDMMRWEREIEDMKAEREKWQQEKEEITESTERKVEEMREILRKRQNSLNGMEEEIRIKGLQIRELEDERKKVSGAEDDEETKERDAADRQNDMYWDHKERELLQRFNNQTIIFHNMKANLEQARSYQGVLLANQTNTDLMYGTASGVDFETSSQHGAKSRRAHQHKSRTNTLSSSLAGQPNMDAQFPNGSGFNGFSTAPSSNFAPGPFYDMNADTGMHSVVEGMSDADFRSLTGGAPLSPTATSLLPSSLFVDDEPPSPTALSRALGPSLLADDEEDSTESSSHSASHFSSPRTSANALPSYHTADSDDRSLHSHGPSFGAIGSPSTSAHPANPSPAKRTIQELFTFPKSRGKPLPVEGPALGSLKAGQSHSFPRQTEDGETGLGRNRRTSFSTGLSSFLSRGHSDVAEGNAPALARNVATRRRGFKMWGSSIDDPTVGQSDRDPGSPRPASIASSDLPRPSMDSNPFGWPVGGETINRASPLATNWSIANYGQQQGLTPGHPWGSHNPSRRPSIQHGSTTALANGVADEDDEFLDPELLSQQSSPPPVGVIGGPRPQSSRSQAPRLNPNAPAFMAMFSRSKTDKGSDKKKREAAYFDDHSHGGQEESHSPSESRKSKDQHSIHTATSMTESYDSLDRINSNTPSDAQTPSQTSKDGMENSFQKLFRKGSSSKFSIGSIGSFSRMGSKSKTGTPSQADRNTSGDRGSSFGDMDEHGEDMLGRSVDSVTSSPMIGSLPDRGGSSHAGTPRERRSAWNRFSISSKSKLKAEKLEDATNRSMTSGAETTEDEKEE